MSCATYYKILAVKVFPRESGGVKRWVLLGGVVSLPSLAVGLVGFYWFTSPHEPPLAARVWLWQTGAELHARAFVGAFPVGQPPPSLDVVLELTNAHETLQRRATTSPDGVADFSVPLDSPFTEVGLRLTDADTPPLVTGAVHHLDVGSWITTRQSTALRPKPPLDDLVVRLTSGVLAVPFLAQVRIEHGEAGCFARLRGADLAAGACCELGCRVYPREHVVELDIGHAPSRLGTVLLPVVPGAMPVSIVNEQVSVFSATPRPLAHLAWITDSEVLRLESVSLEPHVVQATDSSAMAPAGTLVHVGVAALPLAVTSRLERERLWVVTSSEADFVAGATVAWPLGEVTAGYSAAFSPRLEDVALDGFSLATTEHRERHRERLWQLTYGLGFVLLLEAVMLGTYVRKLNADIVGLPLGQRAASFGVVIACLLFAFAGLLGLFWWRM